MSWVRLARLLEISERLAGVAPAQFLAVVLAACQWGADDGHGGVGVAVMRDASVEPPERACESTRLVLEKTAERFSMLEHRGTTRTRSRDSLAACAGGEAGAAGLHRIDLRQLERSSTRLHLLVDAPFDPLLATTRGLCEDPTSWSCVAPFETGSGRVEWVEESPAAQLSLAVIDPNGPAGNDYRLQVIAEQVDVGCQLPTNTTCDAAASLPIDRSTTSTFVPPVCQSMEAEAPASLYYHLDLRDEPAPVGVRARLSRTDRRAFDGSLARLSMVAFDRDKGCGDTVSLENDPTLADAPTLSVALDPGDYVLKLSQRPAQPSALTVQLTRSDCSQAHDTCEEAEAIRLVDDYAWLDGDTYCNTDRISLEPCGTEAAPDRFYRLDLSRRVERSRVQAQLVPGELGFHAMLLLFEAGDDGACGSALYCDDPIGYIKGFPAFDMVLDPGAYVIAVKGGKPAAAGSFTLQVGVSDFRTRSYSRCYGGDIDACLFDNQANDCCDNPLRPECRTSAISCGLDPEAHDCVCRSNPRCCDGATEDFELCAAAFDACDYFCEHTPPGLLYCFGQPELRTQE